MIRPAAISACLMMGTALAADQDRTLILTLPGTARVLADDLRPMDSHALPVGPWTAADGVPALALEGRVERQSWRLDGQGGNIVQLFNTLRDGLAAQGYETLFDCMTETCGGFDFRFGIEVLDAPLMRVSLREFRFAALVRGGDDHVGLLISRAGATGYVQMIRVTDPDLPGDRPEVTTATAGTDRPDAMPTSGANRAGALVAPDDLGARLVAQGHAVLPDLDFATGASELSGGPHDALAALAQFMAANPDARIALVGHTDAVGGLAGNITLSRQRAASVRAALLRDHGVAAGRVDAEGMGYLAPIAPNHTAEGREANRRVEVILLNLQ